MDLPHEFARYLRKSSLAERKAEAAKRVQALIDARPSFAATLERVKATTRQPEPYSQPSKTTITEVNAPARV